MKQYLIFILCILIAVPVLGEVTFKRPSPSEVKDVDLTQMFNLSTSERLEFHYGGTTASIRLLTLNQESATYGISSLSLDFFEEFTLQEGDIKTLDLDKDQTIDVTFSLDEIIITDLRRRTQVIFSTEGYSNKIEPPTPEPINEPVVEEPVINQPQPTPPENVEVVDNPNKHEVNRPILEPINTDEPQEELLENNNNAISSKAFNAIAGIIVTIIILALIGAVFYFFVKEKD